MTRGATRGAALTVGLGADAPAAAIDHVACMAVPAASSRAEVVARRVGEVWSANTFDR